MAKDTKIQSFDRPDKEVAAPSAPPTDPAPVLVEVATPAAELAPNRCPSCGVEMPVVTVISNVCGECWARANVIGYRFRQPSPGHAKVMVRG